MLEQSDIDFEERMVSPEAMPSDEDDVDYSLRPKTLNEYIGQEKDISPATAAPEINV